jgi:cell wall assembly regulator SMI1
MKEFIDLLNDLGAKLREGLDSETLNKIEISHGVTLPEEIRSLYSTTNGDKNEEGCGEWSWYLIPISPKLTTIANLVDYDFDYVVGDEKRKICPSQYICFLDCLIGLPYYAFCADRLSKHFGEVIWFTIDNDFFDASVAALSVSEFLNKFIDTNGEETLIFED